MTIQLKSKTVALRITRELFTWLAENPTKGKDDWPEWEKYELKYGMMRHRCALCHYSNNSQKWCYSYGCLVQWTLSPDNSCNDIGSPYYNWTITRSLKMRSKYARQVVKLVKQAENKLKEERNVRIQLKKLSS